MRRALRLARNGMWHTSPNPMVGAVIVCNGKIIGEGWHRRFGGPHAEVNAVRSVKDRSLLSESTIYVTLEPCSHFGKTPPCANLLVESGFRRVVVGSLDPNEKVAGRGIRILREAGIEVTVGILEKECRELNSIFMTAHTSKRPYVLLKWAMSSDGFMARLRNGGVPEPVRFSTELSSLAVHQLRARFDAIMAGSTTIITDRPQLDTRLFPGRSPVKIAVDMQGRLSGKEKVFQGAPSIYVGPERDWQKKICNLTTFHTLDGHDIGSLLTTLFESGITSLIVEGGARTLKSFIDSGLWDKARIEVSPDILAGEGACRMNIPTGETGFSTIGANTIIDIRRTN